MTTPYHNPYLLFIQLLWDTVCFVSQTQVCKYTLNTLQQQFHYVYISYAAE